MIETRRYSASVLGTVAMIGVFVMARPGQADLVAAPDVAVTSFQHSYFVGGKTTISTLIRDSIQSATPANWTPIWHNPATWTSTLSAPDGYRFVVTPPTGFGQPTFLVVEMNWNVSTPVTDFTVFFSTTSYTLDGFSGSAPAILGSSVAGQALYTLGARANGSVSAPFSFKSITFVTTPPFNLEPFATQNYYSSPTLTLSISGAGALPDATLISLQPVPEPPTCILLAAGGLALFLLRSAR